MNDALLTGSESCSEFQHVRYLTPCTPANECPSAMLRTEATRALGLADPKASLISKESTETEPDWLDRDGSKDISFPTAAWQAPAMLTRSSKRSTLSKATGPSMASMSDMSAATC